VLSKEKIVRMKQVSHTKNEQAMLQAVSHPFIINLWGAFQDCTNLYMVMDFVPGGELFTLLRRSNVSGSNVPNDSDFVKSIAWPSNCLSYSGQGAHNPFEFAS
jgi:serine/threonine protein kinase